MICKTAAKLTNRSELYRFEYVCSRVVSLCNSKSLKEGICVHSPIIKLGFHHHLYMNNNLLSLYHKCFGADHARHFFDKMPYKDVVSWTAIMSAYVQSAIYEKALELFDLMVILGQSPNEFTLSSAIRSCAALRDFDQGTRLQAFVIKHGFDMNPILGSNLIDLYSKCKFIMESYEVFKLLGNGDIVCWTTVISSFVQDRKWSQGLELYIRMIEARIPPNEFTFVKLLVASAFLGLKCGRLVHAHMIMWGVKLNVVLKTALADMYSKCQMMEYAIKVSKLTPECDVFLWTAIISGFTKNLKFREAVAAYLEMEKSGILPNYYTYNSVLNACSSIPSLELGKQIHSRAIMSGLENEVSVGNALVDMYMKCSNGIEDALRVFRGMNLLNVISWTSLIAGIIENGFEQDSFHLFMEMRAVGVPPNSFTLSVILRACGTVNSSSQLMKLHGYVIKTKLDHDTVVGNALVHAYARLGMLDDAWHVFGMMSHRDAITYTSLASIMNQRGSHEMALKIISRMNNDDVKMDGFSLATFLSASAGLTSTETGKQLHCHSLKSGLGSWNSVSNGVVDLYGKCGYIDDVRQAFEEITAPDVFSWNGLISALASSGHIYCALSTFDDMRLAGVKPDSVTFFLVLFACSQGKMVDMGLEYFQSMKEKHGIEPWLDHYVCLVDVLSQAGRLQEALGVIETMPFAPDAMVYKTLLNACKLHRNVPLGEDMARRGLELHPSDPAFYILLANLYDACGQCEFGEKTRRLMRERGLKRNPGQSWMEIRNKVHLFVTGDNSHPQIHAIREKIESIISEFNDCGYVYQDSGDSSYHSERLAVAFGFLTTPSKAPICIINNMPICRDCHNFLTLLTQLVDKKIIVRVGNRIHTFGNGECSCQDY
ncbi:PPR domain-containing protein/PPR_2 domain-containing protein/DYW_deaminase domain-containing protein [Cephalotus follicularis]|uniref:PPR domain-containing protein/PPR_2 domain-containing protein/DYW_deaminase domain-containing protein n=1 Tax=Cephalotus follicularis TaxID=3775 RepID=A0A1Q3C880_CEPFO|nr:PPR domain-containing protein/PPR_2 domain-containing protein/DYW_deaminase domain-containing protein [Cephalotus follicularis]